MSQVVIPFLPRFERPILKGKKTMTCRTKCFGEPGDHFYVAGRCFIIDDISEMRLRDVALEYYLEEGMQTPSEFIAVWNEIHPFKKYRGDDVVFAHRFHHEP